MSIETLESKVMDSEIEEDNLKDIKVNGMNTDAYRNCETPQCYHNENEEASFKNAELSHCNNEFDKHGDNVTQSPSEHGDDKLTVSMFVDAPEMSDECNESLMIVPHETKLSNVTLTVLKDPDGIKNSAIHNGDTNEVADALSYFNNPIFEIEDNNKEVLVEKCEEKLVSVEIPNGITKTTVAKGLKSNASKKQSVYNKKKCKKIRAALVTNNHNALAEAALSEGGLLNDEIRRKVWPKLVGVDVYETSPRPCQKDIEAHPYYNQVVLDVNRSLKRFPPSIHEAQRLMMLDQLVFLIMRVLCRHPEMHYYQGYHDICVTFLLVLGEETAYYVIEKLSRTHLKVFMERNMEPTIHLLEHMYVLIGKKNPHLKDFLLKSEVGVAYCLSWLITWFGHVLNDYNYVVRLFDFFIVSHPYMPMYLTTAIVLHQEKEVLKQDCDMASVHSFLSKISDDLPFEDLILDALNLFEEYTPKMLSVEHPYVPRSFIKPKKKFNLFQSITKTIKCFVPTSNIAIPIVVAAAVLVTAVLYQAYKY